MDLRDGRLAEVFCGVPALSHSSNFPKSRSKWILRLSAGAEEKECSLQQLRLQCSQGEGGGGGRLAGGPHPPTGRFSGLLGLREAADYQRGQPGSEPCLGFLGNRLSLSVGIIIIITTLVRLKGFVRIWYNHISKPFRTCQIPNQS